MGRRLSADDWAAAALDALADGGLAAVAVEPVAARLGATKGSFYWHFSNRQALVDAALARWERLETDGVEAALATIPDPAARLRTLAYHAFTDARDAAIALLLITDAGNPRVQQVAKRVTDHRLRIIEASLLELGQAAEQARDAALATYSMYLGTAALRRTGAVTSGEAAQRAADAVLTALGVPAAPVADPPPPAFAPGGDG